MPHDPTTPEAHDLAADSGGPFYSTCHRRAVLAGEGYDVCLDCPDVPRLDGRPCASVFGDRGEAADATSKTKQER